jgi:tetratricopeptide (TPR) repeat protein
LRRRSSSKPPSPPIGVVDRRRSEVSGPESARSLIPCLLILVTVVLATFRAAINHDFVYWDDQVNVFQNPHIAQWNAAGLTFFWRRPYEALYIPLSYMLFMSLAHISLMPRLDPSVTTVESLYNPHVFHAASVVLHLINSLLVFMIFRKALTIVDLTRRNVPALLGTLLFALHPIQVESVAWITELRGLLAAVFSLAAVYAYLCAIRPNAGADSRDGSEPADVQADAEAAPRYAVPIDHAGYWLALIFSAMAMLSKPAVVSLPIALFAMDRWLGKGRSLRACVLSVLPWALLVTPSIVATHSAQPIDATLMTAWYQRPFVAGDAIAFYMAKLIVPWPLTIDYGRKPGVVLGHWWGYVTWIVPAAVGYIVWRRRNDRPEWTAAASFSLALLLPVLGFMPFVYQGFSTVADRYAYLAMIGPAMLLTFILARAPARRLAAACAFVCAGLAALASVTVTQLQLWKNSFSLFAVAVVQNPDSFLMREDYGIALRQAGRLSEAADQYNEALRIQPGYTHLYADLGMVLRQQGRSQEALDAFRTCVEREPDFAVGRRDYGQQLLDMGDPTDAAEQLAAAVALKPSDASCHVDYGNALLAVNNYPDAAAQYQAALGIDPNMPEALYGLGNVYFKMGQVADAESYARKAVSIAPDDARAQDTLAFILDRQGDYAAAQDAYRRAIALQPGDAVLHYNFGVSLFDHRDVQGAISEFRQAAQLDPGASEYDTLGMVYLASGDKPGAISAYQAELQFDPSSASARQHLVTLGVPAH